MKGISKLWLRLIEILKQSVRRFPEALIAAYACTILAMITNHQNWMDSNDTVERLLMCASFGIPMYSAAILAMERYGVKWKQRIIADGILLLFPVLYYVFMPETFSNWFMARFAAIQFILYALFVATPYFYRRLRSGTYAVKVMTSFFITYLYTLVLFGGFSAIIFTVDQLFDLNIDGEIYADLFFIAVGIFGITYFLGRLGNVEEELGPEDFSKVIRVLLVSIVMPIGAAYTLVLYAYFIKILLQMSWPEGLVGQLVVWYGFISTAVLFMINDLNHNAWVRGFKRFYPPALLIPIGMLFAAIGIRISEYGWTMSRYFVVAAGLWIFSAAVYYIIRSRQGQSTFVVCSFILVTALTFVGPWNAYHVSVASQISRMTGLLEANGMMENGRVVANKNAPIDMQDDISSIVYYLNDLDALDRAGMLPEGFTTADMENVFGFGYQDYWTTSTQYFGYYAPTVFAIEPIENYDYLVQLTSYSGTTAVSSEDATFSLDMKNGAVTLNKGGQVLLEQSLEEVAAYFYDQFGPNNEKGSQQFIYEMENDNVRTRFVFTDISGERTEDGSMIVNGVNGWVFIQIK